jgi:signal transduction histidine kinase
VTDTGVGLDARDLGRLFEMFSQLPTGAGRAQGGLGIGLSLSRRLARLHGGNIEVNSAGVGRGSAFTVRLPDSCLLLPESEPRSTSVRPVALPSVDG